MLVEDREHLRMECASPGGEPLNIAPTVPSRRAERIRMIDEALADDGDGLEPAVRVRREPGNDGAVVNPPTCLTFEVLPKVPSGERRRRPHLLVPRRIGILMRDTGDKRIGRPPRKPEWRNFDYDILVHSITS